MSDASEDSDFAALLAEAGRATPVPLSALYRELELTPGERLLDGRFTLGAKLGQGGMGVVYEAHDAERGGRVALKFLSRLDPASIMRFKLEFRSLADVVHPHLSRMDALFRWRSSWFFSMELLEGQSFLAHHRSLRADARVDFLRRALPQLEAGLSTLHRLGKLHCDLKPSNVFVSPTGHVTIVDFGLVVDRALDDARHTLGTPGYLAPELRNGQAPSPASDWYALGVMLHQALTGELPRPGLPALVGAWPADLTLLCKRLLHVDPAVRHRDHEPAEPSPGCVGRRKELACLHDALARARTGRRVLCRLFGPSGNGKTTVLRAFLQALDAREVLVLDGRCFEREFTPFKLLDGVVDALAKELARRHLTISSAVLARAFASIARLTSEAPQLERTSSDEAQRRQLGEALCQALGRAQEQRTLVIAIDDAQWADADGAALCTSVLQNVPSLLLVLVQRDEPETMVQACGTDLLQLHVDALPPEEMRELLLQLPAARVSPDDIIREAQGSPYLARELMLHVGRAPNHAPTLEHALGTRMAELPREAITALQLVALSGAPLEAHVLAHAAGARDVERTLALLRAHSLLRTHAYENKPARADVYHDRVRNVVLSMLAPHELRALHARLGDALELFLPQEPERIAAHLQGAEQLERAAPHAWRAGRRAAASLAFERAAQWLTLAQQGTSEEQLARELGDVLALLGRHGEAGSAYLQAAKLATRPETLALLAAGQLLCGGQLQRGFEILRANLGGPHGGLPTAAELPLAIPRLLMELVGLLHAPLPSPASDLDRLAQVDACHAATLGLAGADNEGIGLYFLLRQAVEALQLGDPLRIVRALELTAALASCTLAPDTKPLIAHMEGLAARIAETLTDPRIAFWRAFRQACQAYWSFEQRAAHEHVAHAQDLAKQCHGVQRERVLLWFCCGFRDFEAGRLDAHLAHAAEVQLQAVQRDDVHAQMWSELIDLRSVFSGELEQRRELLQALPARYAGALVGMPHYVLEWQLATAERAFGRLTEAHARMESLVAAARSSVIWSVPRNRSLLLSEAIAGCLAAAARCDDREPWLSQAETLLSEQPAPPSWLLPPRAALALLRGDRALTRELLAQTSVLTDIEHVFWITQSARLLLAMLDADSEAERRSERVLREAGLRKPRQFVEHLFPGMLQLLRSSSLHKRDDVTPSP